MRHLEYDIRLAVIIKSIRVMRRIKQAVVANALAMKQTTYCRIEQGEIAITPGQLKIIANVLYSSIYHILTIVEIEDLSNVKYETISEKLSKLELIFEEIKTTKKITDDELLYIVEKIKSHRNP